MFLNSSQKARDEHIVEILAMRKKTLSTKMEQETPEMSGNSKQLVQPLSPAHNEPAQPNIFHLCKYQVEFESPAFLEQVLFSTLTAETRNASIVCS